MPRYTPNPTNVIAGFAVYPKGVYYIELGTPVAFATKEGSDKSNYGINFPAKIVSSIDQPSWVGKPMPTRCFQHSDGGLSYSKGIQMAALGVKKDDEFNEKFGGEDWSFDTDDKSCGGGWHKMANQVIGVEIGEVEFNKQTQTEQTGKTRYFAL